MKKIVFPALLVTGVIAVGAAAFWALEPLQAQDVTNASAETSEFRIQPDTIYATVNGQPITGKDVQAILSTLPPQVAAAPQDRILSLLVNQMVNDRLIAEKAQAEQLEASQEVQARFAAAKQEIIREAYIRREVDAQVTEQALKQKFDELVAATPAQEETHARHILVEDEETAKDLIKQLDDGADFAELAKEHSTGPTNVRGGDLGYFTKTAMVPEFAEVAFALAPGTYSKSPVKTDFGWHVIKVEDRRMQPKPDFEEVKPRVKNVLQQELVQKMIENLRETAKIELNLPEAAEAGVEPAAGQE